MNSAAARKVLEVQGIASLGWGEASPPGSSGHLLPQPTVKAFQKNSGGRERVSTIVISVPVTGVSVVTSKGWLTLILCEGQLSILKIHPNRHPPKLLGFFLPHDLSINYSGLPSQKDKFQPALAPFFFYKVRHMVTRKTLFLENLTMDNERSHRLF